MNFRQMQIFEAVIRGGSASGAARLLGISQAAVSKVLRQLEDELETSLFVRGHGALQPSSEGKLLYLEVKRVFDDLVDVERVATDLKRRSGGRVSIAATFSLAQTGVAAAVARLSLRHRLARFVVVTANTREVERMVLEGETDIGVVFEAISHPYIVPCDLDPVKLVCLVPKGHPFSEKSEIGPADLAQYPLIGGTRGHIFGAKLARVFSDAGLTLDFKVEVSAAHLGAALVANGAGLALVDPFIAATLSDELVVRPFMPTVMLNPKVIYRPDLYLTGLHHSFIDELRTELARLSRNAP